ncbi:MAG: class I SAM-dependent methyltransferase [Patescibacteria group bacterium]
MKYENEKLLDLYQLKVEEHWLTMFSPILKYLGDLKGKRVLDIGCGSGELTSELAKSAKQVVGLDLSKKWISRCQNKYHQKNLQFVQADASDLKLFRNNSFDMVVMNMVLLNVHPASLVSKVLHEVKRVVKSGGDFIFSDLHPLCIMTKKEGRRRQEYAKNFSYFKDGAEFSPIIKLVNNKEIKFTDHHWTLDFYTQELSRLNIYIKRIIESRYPESAPKKFYRYSFPEYIIFCCKKII